ncbi:hypothetical protein AB0M32_36120 [Streptomyces sp. NPDC051985]|uniref:hypothetical protein n=1 Tax=Streptomyces sp. NPDC051985 TaxID=3155807 RepID=UPI003434E11A
MRHQRGGRPWGEIRAASAEAHALAVFLRARVTESGKTLTVLQAEINYSRSQISVFLGGQVPETAFVEALLGATVTPDLLERRRTQAAGLLRAARNPQPAARPAGAVTSAGELAAVRGQQVEVYERFTRALEQQNELRQTAENSAKLTMVLLAMVSRLQQRITDLTNERDRLLATPAGTGRVEQTEQQLARASEQAQRAQQELRRTQDKLERAEALTTVVQSKAERLAAELDQLRGTGTDRGEERTDAPYTRGSGPRPAEFADPAAEDIDQALTRAAAVNDQDDRTLQRISDDLGERASSDRVVPDNPSDNSATRPYPALDRPAGVWLTTKGPFWRADQAAKALTAAAEGDILEAARLYRTLNRFSTRFPPEHAAALLHHRDLSIHAGETGQYAAAAETLDGLTTSYTHVLGPHHPDTLHTQHQYARFHGMAGHYTAAQVTLSELLPRLEAVLGAHNSGTLRARRDRAHFLGMAGHYAQAEHALAELGAVHEQTLGLQDPDTLRTWQCHAYFRGHSGDYAGASEELDTLLSGFDHVLGPDHPDTLITRHHHAYYHGMAGHYTDAEHDLAGLVTHFDRILGPSHPDTLAAQRSYAHFSGMAGNHAGARDALVEIRSRFSHFLGPHHPETFQTCRCLAKFRGLSDRASTGRALDIPALKSSLGPYLPQLRHEQRDRADGRGVRWWGGSPDFDLPAVESALGARHPETLHVLRDLTYIDARSLRPGDTPTLRLLRAWQTRSSLLDRVLGPNRPEPAQARPIDVFAQLLPLYEEALGPLHPETLHTRHHLAYFQALDGNPGTATTVLTALHPHYKEAFGPLHPETLHVCHHHAYFTALAGDADAAAEALTDLVPFYDRALGGQHPEAFRVRYRLAQTIALAGDRPRTVSLLTELVSQHRDLFEHGHPYARSARNTWEHLENSALYTAVEALQLDTYGDLGHVPERQLPATTTDPHRRQNMRHPLQPPAPFPRSSVFRRITEYLKPHRDR